MQFAELPGKTIAECDDMVVRRDHPGSRAALGNSSDETLIGVTLMPPPSLTSPAESADADSVSGDDGARRFKIRMTGEAGHRHSTNVLIERRYTWRGYFNPERRQEPAPVQVGTTISATESDVSIGTITVGVDGQDKIFAEEIFQAEVDTLRRNRSRVCEFTKLAVDPIRGSRKVLAGLFHTAYVVAYYVYRCDTLILEVNPRHVAYYQRMLGCSVLGAERLNLRVNAPAVLLNVDFSYIREQIARCGGQPALAATERSLYPHAFSASQEAWVLSRFKKGRVLEVAGAMATSPGPDTIV